jgi:hypothetical protein
MKLKIDPKPSKSPGWYTCGKCGSKSASEQSARDCCAPSPEKPGQHSRDNKKPYKPAPVPNDVWP